MKMKGMIFDFNGTLFFDSHLHERAWLEVAEQLTGKKPSVEEYYEKMHGRTNKGILKNLLGSLPSDEECYRIGEEKEAYYRRLCLEESDGKPVLAPGAAALLDFLTEKGLPRAIATSAGLSNVEFYREIFGLDRWFTDDKLVYDDGTLNSKPAPDLYLLAARRIGIHPSELAMAEDSFSGLRAVNNAGAGYRVGISPTGEKGFKGIELTDTVISSFDMLDRNIFEVK